MHRIDTSIPHFFSHLRVTHIVFTSEIVSEVLHVPRVANPDYPGCEHLRIVSNDELSSLFCETLLLLTLHLLMCDFVMIKPKRTFRRTFLDEAFIPNAKSSYRIFLILTYPLLSIVGVRGHCVTS